MITPKQLTTLRKYAADRDKGITLEFEDNRVVIYHLGEKYIALPNKPSSCLTMKSVKHHIDNCYGKDSR
jgi:hypothetical protein